MGRFKDPKRYFWVIGLLTQDVRLNYPSKWPLIISIIAVCLLSTDITIATYQRCVLAVPTSTTHYYSSAVVAQILNFGFVIVLDYLSDTHVN